MIGGDEGGRSFHGLLVFDVAGFDGDEKGRGELKVGQALVAEARIAFVVFPLVRAREPGAGVRESVGGKAEAFAGGGVKGAGSIGIIVAGEALVFARPRWDFAGQKGDGFAFGQAGGGGASGP